MRVLALSLDFQFQIDLQEPDIDTGRLAGASGVSGLGVRIALTKGGAAINAALDVSLQERTGNRGRYFALFDTTDLITHLTTFVGQTVWLVLYKAGDIESLSFPYRVARYAVG